MKIEDAFKNYCNGITSIDRGFIIKNINNIQLVDLSNVDYDDNGNYINFALPFPNIFIKYYHISGNKLFKCFFIVSEAEKPFEFYLSFPFMLDNNDVLREMNIHAKILINIEANGLEMNYKTEFGERMESESENLFSEIVATLFRTLLSLIPKKTILYRVKSNLSLKKNNKKSKRIEKSIYIYVDRKIEKRNKSLIKKDYQFIERFTSWSVRGHWRQLNNKKKRGKDAYGKRIVEGYTWVSPYIKGNKNITPRKRSYIAINDRKEIKNGIYGKRTKNFKPFKKR